MTAKPWIPAHPNPPRATPADFERAARQLGCTPAEIRAVWKVEAAGRPFRADGSVERRFEPHHFPRTLWATLGFTVRPNEAPWRASLRQSNNALANRAFELDAESMLRASSWGAPQIMGFNHQDAGHIAARNMVEAMAKGEAEHLNAFTTLINAWKLAPAIRAHDWERFARRYNGPGQVQHYANLLERAMGVTSAQKHAAALEAATRSETGAPSRVVLRLGSEGPAVAKLQRALQIEDDGVFGTNTERAVQRFQEDNTLAVDGVVGARTWRTLDANELLREKIDVQSASAKTAAAGAGAAVLAPAAAAVGATASVNIGAAAVVAALVIIVIGGAILWRSRR